MKGHLLGQVLSLYNKNCTYQFCKQQSADTRHNKQLISIISKMADTDYQPIIVASLMDSWTPKILDCYFRTSVKLSHQHPVYKLGFIRHIA